MEKEKRGIKKEEGGREGDSPAVAVKRRRGGMERVGGEAYGRKTRRNRERRESVVAALVASLTYRFAEMREMKNRVNLWW